jgi:hypothetical protein
MTIYCRIEIFQVFLAAVDKRRVIKKGRVKPAPVILFSAALFQTVEICNHLGRMVGRCDRIVRHGDFAIRADKHGFPRRTWAVGFGDAIGDRHRAVFVAQQVVGKREFIAECTVIGRAVIADADDGCITVFKVLDSITEPVAFDRSAGCVGFGIPPEQNITPGKVIFLDRGAVLVREAEIRRINAGGNQCHSGFSIGWGWITAEVYHLRSESGTAQKNPGDRHRDFLDRSIAN